ncbi:matrixin family metalloprotease [Cupriavidus pauculus]|uniref:matrixin family metalloprotease n=1 Tax=Cupriavidus pauculus TaxID=82633 RepID=UPI001244032B|nr:matrixin family metalloprotease [Cupriavidus pauculus]KAB0600848.1 matrixin family metalloprotease [Cupriavidus pauculus]MCM3605384.1 M10 family metallopeptidase domain-containing protein [Cupriavidus pauculus]UAL02672.1 matrixin family metalloprotease [Cupriavidus pauculus]
MPTSFRDIHDSLVARGLIVDHDFSSLKPDDKLPAALRDALAHYVPSGNGIQLHPRVRDFDSPTLQAILDALNRPHCGVPNGSHGPTQIQTFGSPGGRWDRGVLTFSIDPAGSGLPPNDVVNTIAGAFAQWQAASGFFSFTRVDSGGDIQLRFGGTELRSYFGSAGGVLADGGYPPSGRINFDSAEAWTTAGLLSVSLHEIGHVLGLSHSNDRRSLMYPYDLNAAVIDSESTDAIRNLYGWRPQIQLGDRATSDRPALAVRSRATSTQTLHMVWKGTGDDQGIYESQLVNNVWSQQKKISGIGSTESPALATIRASDTSNGLIMAWKGVKGDQGLYYSIIGDGDWAPQRKIPNVGSNHRPALANFNGTIYMAWKGVDGDQGIYWSIISGGNWTPQRKINGVGTHRRRQRWQRFMADFSCSGKAWRETIWSIGRRSTISRGRYGSRRESYRMSRMKRKAAFGGISAIAMAHRRPSEGIASCSRGRAFPVTLAFISLFSMAMSLLARSTWLASARRKGQACVR